MVSHCRYYFLAFCLLLSSLTSIYIFWIITLYFSLDLAKFHTYFFLVIWLPCNFLSLVSSYFMTRLCWVPGNSRNCKADELASHVLLFHQLPNRNGQETHGFLQCTTWWLSLRRARNASFLLLFFWLRVNRQRLSELLALSKFYLSTVIRVPSGHCPIRIHAVKVGDQPPKLTQYLPMCVNGQKIISQKWIKIEFILLFRGNMTQIVVYMPICYIYNIQLEI